MATKVYNEIVPFGIAKILNIIGYTKDSGYQYDEKGHLCDPAAPGGVSGICEAPTYAEVFDWFYDNDIVINMIGIFVGPNFVWDWEIYSPKCHETDDCYEDFFGAANDAIQKAIVVHKNL